MKVKLEMMGCIKCGGDMPVLRFAKYGYRSCINCSTTEKVGGVPITNHKTGNTCLLYTSPSPRDTERSRMPSSA